MIDCHSHIIYGIDDGCKTIEDSIDTIKNLNSIGFDEIILTPHYMEGTSYVCDNKEKKKRLNIIKDKLKELNINVKLYLGNEVYITENMHELVLDNKITTLNKSRYILFELPLYSKLNNVEDFIYELKLKGYKPVLAHPERYLYIQDNYDEIKPLLDSGALLQCNYGSLIGGYGKDAQKLIEYLLKNNLVTFMATDIHRKNSHVITNFDDIKKRIIKLTSEDTFNKITHDNILKVINDIEIES